MHYHYTCDYIHQNLYFPQQLSFTLADENNCGSYSTFKLIFTFLFIFYYFKESSNFFFRFSDEYKKVYLYINTNNFTNSTLLILFNYTMIFKNGLRRLFLN